MPSYEEVGALNALAGTVGLGAAGAASAIRLGPQAVPADYGYLGWSYDPAFGSGNYAAVSGTVAGVRLWLPACTVTNITLHVTTAGSTLTAGESFAALYSGANPAVLLSATADQSASWNSVGIKTMALTTPQAVSTGFYNICLFSVGTTPPNFARVGSITSLAVNQNLPTGALRAYTADTARTTSFPATQGAQTGQQFTLWAAVS